MTAARENTFTLKELADLLGAELKGDGAKTISGIATLASAQPHQLSFLANSKYLSQLPSTQAGAVLLDSESVPHCHTNALILDDPYLAYAKLSHHFNPAPKCNPGIHPSAIIDVTATIEDDVHIGANVVVEAHAVVGKSSVVECGSVIGAYAQIGKSCHLHSRVTLNHHVILHDRVTLHSGVVIGADGFGFANQQGRWQKIAQIGSVVIHNDVDIGALTSVDRGALDDTVIEEGVIIDNHVQIAHNCHIGAFTAIAGCVGIAGSTRIGKYCTIAGQAGIAGHLTIADKVHIAMQAQVTNSISQPGSYSSGTGLLPSNDWRKMVVRLRQLDQLARQVKSLLSRA